MNHMNLLVKPGSSRSLWDKLSPAPESTERGVSINTAMVLEW